MFLLAGMKLFLLCMLGFIIGTKGDQCTTPNGEAGECVNIKTCKYLMAIVQKPGKTDFDNFLLSAHAHVCTYTRKQYSACCPITEMAPPETTTIKATVAPIEESCIDGHCVEIRNCSVLFNIAMNPGITQKDRKYLQDRRCNKNANSFSVCCPEPKSPDNTVEVPIVGDAAGQECKTPRGVPGICMAVDDCIPISILFRKEQTTQEELQFLEESECDSETLYCCPTVVISETETPTTSTTAAPMVEKCETPNGANGTCISVIHCESLMRILQKTVFAESDAKYLNASFCGDGVKFPKVCCPETPAAEDLSLPLPPYCGTVFPTENDFDAGAITSNEEYPWTALLLYKNEMGKTSTYCGGTLIHERYVLTAAHCLYEQDPEWILTGVRLGVWTTTVMQMCENKVAADQLGCESTAIELAVSKVIKHPEYVSLYNDLALLQLTAPVRATRYVTPICLPFGSKHISASSDDDTALQMSGWGAYLFAKVTEFKMKSIAQVWSLQECKNRYLTEAGVNLTAKHICVKGKGADDVRILDSGGALMSLANIGKMQSYFLLGVEAMSYDFPPEKGFPFIFTRISAYLDWIKGEIRGN